MHKTIRHFLTLTLALLFTTIWVQAQDSTAKASKRGIRFVCTGIAPDSSEELKLLGKNGLYDVELSVRAPGELFEVPANGVIILGEESNDPKNPVKALAKGKMPANTSRATALLIPTTGHKDGLKYEMFVIADGNLKGGSAYFLNLTQNNCVARLDGEILRLLPGKPIVYQPANLSEARNSPIAIMVETREEDAQNWRPLMSSTWRLRPTRIEVCVVYWNEQIMRPSIKGLTLFPIDQEDVNG